MKRFSKYLSGWLLFLSLILPSYIYAADGIPVVQVGGGINTNLVLDNKIRTQPLPYGDAIAEGIIPGHTPFIKYGANGAVGTTEELIWTASNGRTYLSAAETLKVSSSDADDTAAGTGARTIILYGQTTGYVEANDTITLNGATPVETSVSFLRIYRAIVLTAGSSGINEGLISIKDNANTLQKAEIVANRGQSQMAFFTVPADRTLYIKHISASESGNKKVTLRLYARDNTVTDASWQLKTVLVVNLSTEPKQFFTPLKFTEKIDIRVMGESALAGGIIDDVTLIGYYED